MEKAASKFADRLITAREVERRVVYSRVHLRRLVAQGLFPRPRQIGPNRIAWPLREVIDWMQIRSDQRACAHRGVKPAVLDDTDRFISKNRVRILVRRSSEHIRQLESEGKFPPRILLGSKRVAWLEREIIDWISAQPATRSSPFPASPHSELQQ